MPYVCINTDVDVDVDEVLERLSEDDLETAFQKHLKGSRLVVPPGLGDGDRQAPRYIEEAFLAAKALADCPQAIKDLFWHVHGRAM